ncbi:MAG: protein-export chaperone SecB [Bacteroidia bacterium]|nr:protein-export chaperone SecB [Bacteroidia bacterium]
MQKAAFSIINYQFDRVQIDLNNHKSKDLALSFETKGLYDNEKSTFELQFVVNVANNEAENPFVEVSCKGNFKFENVTSFEEIPDFFYRNSIAILFPYVRAYLSLVTTQANVPGVILPTLNLSNLETELKNNTTSK